MMPTFLIQCEIPPPPNPVSEFEVLFFSALFHAFSAAATCSFFLQTPFSRLPSSVHLSFAPASTEAHSFLSRSSTLTGSADFLWVLVDPSLCVLFPHRNGFRLQAIPQEKYVFRSRGSFFLKCSFASRFRYLSNKP